MVEEGATATLTFDTILMENLPKIRGWAAALLGRLATPEILVVVNELMTNAIEHGTGSPISLTVDSTDGLMIQVSNPATAPPIVKMTSADARRGRGMAIVAALADDLDISFDDSGMITVTTRWRPSS